MKPAILALALALAPLAANAGEITLDKPLQGATLPGSETDMAVYFTKSQDSSYHVHAAYIGKDAEGQPKRMEMELRDGDAVLVKGSHDSGAWRLAARSRAAATRSRASGCTPSAVAAARTRARSAAWAAGSTTR